MLSCPTVIRTTATRSPTCRCREPRNICKIRCRRPRNISKIRCRRRMNICKIRTHTRRRRRPITRRFASIHLRAGPCQCFIRKCNRLAPGATVHRFPCRAMLATAGESLLLPTEASLAATSSLHRAASLVWPLRCYQPDPQHRQRPLEHVSRPSCRFGLRIPQPNLYETIRCSGIKAQELEGEREREITERERERER